MAEQKETKAKTRWLEPETKRRRLLFALAIYVVVTVTMAIVAGPERLRQHTAFNHYAQLADAWAHGHQDLYKGPASYSQMNDFGRFPPNAQGKWYITFPPFTAMLMFPFVALAGSAEEFQDGQFMVWLSGIAPAVLFLVLEKLRRKGDSPRSERENVFFALLFAFGTVYFFTAVEGTTWFAHHVVAAALLALYMLFAIDAERPWLAGLMMGFIFLTRPHVLLAAPLMALEAIRVSCKDGLVTEGSLLHRIERTWESVDKRALVRRLVPFAIPILVCMAFASWMNYERWGRASPTAFGHEYLTVAWQGRMAKWGVFGYHYLAKNLGVVFTILPFPRPPSAPPATAPFQINEHGLALWFVTPIYFYLLWPKKQSFLHTAVLLSALGPAVMDLLYQNSGWRQFSYRFSNDYAPLLFVALALGARPLTRTFKALAAWGVAWNLFGAVTFDRSNFDSYYFREGTQRVLYQDD
jgi:hypothetical protein